MYNISIIAAIGENHELGKDNQLPWRISGDLKRFKKITSGHTVIMGRKTFDSIQNKPLPNRRNIIITRDRNYNQENIEIVNSPDAALKKIDPSEEVFIVGGAAIYELFLPVTNRLYLTVVHKSFEADVYFPKFLQTEWKEIEHIDVTDDPQSGLDYSYITLQRI
jgi:dihydrofolate reductase